MKNCELGVFVKCPHPEMIEAIGISGLNFAVVDMEHTPLGPKELYPLVLAAERRNLSLIVRIPFKQDAYFKWCRDLNVSRIQVPHIETVADVEYAVKHSYFNPVGERGLCRFVRAADFGNMPKTEYIQNANQSNRLILQIEGQRGLDNIDAIIDAVPPGVSLFIGPYDLSQSMGRPGDIWHDDVVSAMQSIVLKCEQRGISVGTFTDTHEGVDFWSKRGLQFIQYASDLDLFVHAAKDLRFAPIMKNLM
jgi:4-hydroxy-2-oxoheptanedioate aldolase